MRRRTFEGVGDQVEFGVVERGEDHPKTLGEPVVETPNPRQSRRIQSHEDPPAVVGVIATDDEATVLESVDDRGDARGREPRLFTERRGCQLSVSSQQVHGLGVRRTETQHLGYAGVEEHGGPRRARAFAAYEAARRDRAEALIKTA